MLIEEVRKLTPHERFLYWIKERRKILFAKRKGVKKPWTDDIILQNNYFTNVCREDDKVTRWFRENIRDPLRDSSRVVFATVAFRWFNYIPTGRFIIYQSRPSLFVEWDLGKALETLEKCKKVNGKVFTGAFNISNSGSTKPKINRVCEDYIQPVWENRECLITNMRNSNTLKRAFDHLRCLPGLGGSGFMAAQVVCDLAYTSVLDQAVDFYTWCSWGPGSKRGMNRLHGYPENHHMSKPVWESNLEKLRKEVLKSLGLRLHARDLQNCLCEFSKYERGLEGTRLKRRYPGK